VPHPIQSNAWAGLLILLTLPSRSTAAPVDYQLPGTMDTSSSTYPDGDPRNGLHRVARDSRGYWYVVWENNSQTDIVMAYSTTSTPANAGCWALVTLVDNAAGGVIAATPANSTSGSAPSICIGLDDVLHFVWRAANTSSTCFHAQCSSLTAVSSSPAWTIPLLVGTNITDYSFALDFKGSPHLAGRGVTVKDLLYTKYDTATTAWLAAKTIGTQLSTSTAAQDSISLAIDFDSNVYVAWRGADASVTSNIYLLSSSNADDVPPSASTWKNLAQTNATPDTVNSGDALGSAPTLAADCDGFLRMGWTGRGFDPIQKAPGLIGLGFVNATTTGSKPCNLGIASLPMGKATYFLYARTNTIRRAGYDAATSFRTIPATTTAATLQSSVAATNGCLSASYLPRDIDSYYWFALDFAHRKILSTDTPITGMTGWSPPSQEARRRHPDFVFSFPSGNLPLPGSIPGTLSAYTSKSAVYVADGSSGSHLYAIDSVNGVYSRSYTLKSAYPTYITAAAYSGNVHLYAACNACRLLALIDNGTSISADPHWGNNPRTVGNATGGGLHSLIFYSESSIRYLYMLASRDPVNIGINKLSADHGNAVAGFPTGTAYAPNATESTIRIINDNVYVAGNTSQVYRRGADGSAETMSSAVINAVRHLMLVRNNNDLFVSPAGNRVYRLTSGLLTSTWTSGRSADLRPLTSGAYRSFFTDLIYVGAGNQIYKVNINDGSLMSNTPVNTAGNIVTLPFQWSSYVYFGTDTGMLFAVNATTPSIYRPNWPITLPASPAITAAVADVVTRSIYVVADRRVYRFRLEN